MDTIGNDFVVTAIPSDPQRKYKRGFNLSELIAKKLAKKLKLKYVELLKKNKSIDPFEKMTKKQRQQAIKGSISLKNKIYKKIILVDDVVTTGTTLQEGVRVLKKAGATQVTCLTVCYKPLRSTV